MTEEEKIREMERVVEEKGRAQICYELFHLIARNGDNERIVKEPDGINLEKELAEEPVNYEALKRVERMLKEKM